VAGGGILRPPYGAARSLLEWGIDLWPYVNGKAIVNGLQLASMEASDMLDVLHYFFEDDLNYASAEQAEARDRTRINLYESLYNSSYKYTATRAERNFNEVKDFDAPQEKMPEPFSPASKPKPYVAPTNFDPNAAKPFGSLLDAPFER
jgi:hypothetical protein